MDEQSLQALKIAAKSVQTFANAFAKVSTTINQVMKKSVEAITKTWQKTATAINQSWQKTINAINQSLKKASNTIVQAWQKAANGISQAWQKTVNQISQSWQRTSNGINKSWQKTGSSMNQIWQRANSGINRGWKQAGNNINRAWQQANNGIHKGWNRATSGYNRIQQQKTRQGPSSEAIGDNKIANDSNNKSEQGNKGEEVHNSFRNKVGKLLDGMRPKILGFIQNMGLDAIKGASKSEDMRARFNAQFGNREEGTEAFKALRAQALLNGKDVDKSLKSGLALTSVTKNTQDLLRMNEMVQRLSALQAKGGNPEESAGLMKAAYFGNSADLLKQLNIPVSAKQQEKLESFSKTGDLNGFIQAFDSLMNKANMGRASMELLMDSPVQKWEGAINRFNGLLAATGESALQSFGPVLDLLNLAFLEGRFDPFFASIQKGMTIIANVVGVVVSFLLENWNLVENALLVLGAIAAALAVAWLVQWIMAAWPLLLIIGAIVLIMTALNALGISTSAVIGTIAGVFAVFFAYVKNIFAYMWNLLVTFFEFAHNSLIDFPYAVQKLFYEIGQTVLQFIGNLVNSFVDALNWAIQKVNDLTGSEFKLASRWEYENILKDYEPKSSKGVKDYSDYRMKQTNLVDAFKDTQKYVTDMDFTKNLMPDTSKFKQGGKTDPWSGSGKGGTVPVTGLGTMPPMNIPKVGEVGKVGAIDNKVEITDESIEMMRDLAEMDSIQNFVSLTPTVQVNTGDIHQGFDMDTLINRIEKKLEEEFVSTAEGVYG
ncbi:hypothetical protein ABE142_17865 [Paenibacillus alvei]|uniref:hypothetical protein n=1 Tax=Paenibacillus alvei TaxID=44250 RepID=UPI0018CFC1B0|nr:hypothetical protein [Paenibacillus alvei]MBG9737262.1 hypothetical protein [Paenibacillus alvei]MBG9746356.1 hypothetical protein [Paenibacillus alvei]MCY9581715.1 hypothetical protein [Paenibacillus alvei]MCY9586158.1 hypothetical protein [Paenibacillus alvei]